MEQHVIPKGLRAFDEHDAGFFLSLLPGPRDRSGLPESIRFWKTRIEKRDPDSTFQVGLIYGPSGCGKSSFVRAGLLPRLNDSVSPVYIEATLEDTEVRLQRSICKIVSAPIDSSLPDMIRHRRGQRNARKVLIVIDQFEQWLHSHHEGQLSELVDALRQCDGGEVQCVLLVRDDFWMPVTRFMRELEVPLVDGHNIAAVDLFSMRHAQKVLTKFGQSYDCLPEELTEDQETFISKSIEEMSEDGKVICVRLALFSQMIKDKPWATDLLQQLGGTEGVGINFLEETFSSRVASPEHRLHHKAARAVLERLLPDAGSDIKGGLRSREDLLEASGYARSPDEFDDLMRVLDAELRLVTLTDPLGQLDPDELELSQAGQHEYYQLTHDYLVPSLREWLTQKRKETCRGRAELRLEEIASHWNSKPERRYLPSFPEYLKIRVLTASNRWTDPQTRMIGAAERVYLKHGFLITTLTILATVAFYWCWYRPYQISQTETLVEVALVAPDDELPLACESLLPLRNYAEPYLRRAIAGSRTPAQRFNAAFALAELGHDLSAEAVCELIPRLEDSPAKNNNLVELFRKLGSRSTPPLERILKDTTRREGDSSTVIARLATLLFVSGHPEHLTRFLRVGPDPTDRTLFIHHTAANWERNLLAFAEMADGIEDPDVRSGLALAIGNLTVKGATVKHRWQAVFERWYLESKDAGTRNASEWALRNWGLAPPTPRPVPDADWVVHELGLVMVKIPKGTFSRPLSNGNDQRVRISYDFMLSDREIPLKLYRQFVEESNLVWTADLRKRPHPADDDPAHNVSWNHAVRFCNWLSRNSTGMKECYKQVDDGTWGLDSLFGGYRLPTEAEWEYAARAGVSGQHLVGDKSIDLKHYAVFLTSRFQPSGSKMPNPWGLFDVQGNMMEWCYDWYVPYPVSSDCVDPIFDDPSTSVFKRPKRSLRGGSWSSVANSCSLSGRTGSGPHTFNDLIGMRVAFVPEPSPVGR